MKGMLSNKRLLEQGNSRILRWTLWFDGFDFDIIYESGKEICLADMLTREGNIKDIKVFEKGESSKSVRTNFQIELCSNCLHQYCWECFSQKIKALPIVVQQLILCKWYNSQEGGSAYNINWNMLNNIHLCFGHTTPPRDLWIVYIFDPSYLLV